MARQRRRSERGVALAFIGVWLLTLFALIVVAVDVARFSHTASEVQAIADLAALSGAKSVLVRGAGTAQNGADVAVRQNVVDGQAFKDDTTVGSLQVVEGCYTPPPSGCSTNCQGSFNGPQSPPCPSGPPQQFEAVSVTATRKGVEVVTATLIDPALAHDVTKGAIAAIVGINAVAGNLPVTLCPSLLAQLQPGQTCVQDAVLQQMAFVPNGTQNSCYTSLSPAPANADTFRNLLPPECGGLSTGRPVVSLGEDISLQNGGDSSFLMALKSCVASGVHDFVVPVVQCGNCTGTGQVTDFVTLHIADPSQVVATGNTNHGIYNATQVCNNSLPGSSGTVNDGVFASRQVILVQ